MRHRFTFEIDDDALPPLLDPREPRRYFEAPPGAKLVGLTRYYTSADPSDFDTSEAIDALIIGYLGVTGLSHHVPEGAVDLIDYEAIPDAVEATEQIVADARKRYLGA